MDLSSSPPDHLGLRMPRYQQLVQWLAARIEGGQYPIGGLLPGEQELCRMHNLSRHTVREALSHLQSIGLIEKRQGVGTTVLAGTPPRAFAHTIDSIEQVQQYAQDTQLVDHHCALVSADAALALALPCDVGARFLRIEALRISCEHPRRAPLAWTSIHVIERYAGVQTHLCSARVAIGRLIEQTYGERITAIEQDVQAVSITPALASVLAVEAGTPGLQVVRRYLGADGRPFEFASSIHPSSRFGLTMRLESLHHRPLRSRKDIS
jgi:GntR family transcriptional regulator